MNFIFLSPTFPKTYYHFCEELKKNGVNILGIAEDSYDNLSYELRSSLCEYYRVNSMENYDEVWHAVNYFQSKYGHIDFVESNNEYWLELEARLRSDFNITTGKNKDEILYFKSKEAMKVDYAKANVKTARYHIPTTFEEGKKFLSQVGYPVIVKPDNGVGAYATYKIHNEDELRKFYFEDFPPIKYIMEEFIQGDLISFDGVTNADAEVVFSTNEVFPQPVMNIVNERLDCLYYSNKEMPSDLYEQGKRVLKAFGARNRYFHLEFFRLTVDKPGLGKKGDLLGLEVNMRCPGGYTPDIINYSKNVNTYKIWADSLTYNLQYEIKPFSPHYCAYYGRRDGKNYVYSHEEIWWRYGYHLKMNERMPDILSGAMGNEFFVANFDTKEEMDKFFEDCSKVY